MKYFFIVLITTLNLSACSSSSLDRENSLPITNPFYSYPNDYRFSRSSDVILRSKNGNQALELQMPGNTHHLSNLVLPIPQVPAATSRKPAYEGSIEGLDNSYKNQKPSYTDQEIINSMPRNAVEASEKQIAIEKGLNLVPMGGEITEAQSSTSYLASVDHIKQLYKLNRFEIALLEVDHLILQYPSDAKLYEMRGTLLDRLGKHDLAIKAWNQALRVNPRNSSLKKFVERKLAQEGHP